MPSDRLEIRIPASKLLIGMLLIVIPICIAGLVSLAFADRSLERTVGNHFKTIAEVSASEVSGFIHDRVTDVGVMAMEFSILDAVTAANAPYAGKADAAIAAGIEAMEKQWNTPAAEPFANRLLGSRASQLLRKHREFDPRFLRVTVTDAKGAVVAATHKTLDYYQADEEFWQNIYANGRGSVSLTDVLYDEVTKANYVGIGVPILEPETNRFLGAVDALVDVSAIFPVVQRMQFGATARLMLVKDDGTVIAAPQASLADNLKSQEFATVRDTLRSITGRQTGYLVADVGDTREVIGFADTGLKDDYGKLSWLVLSVQNADEAFASVRIVDRMLALMSLLGLLGVTLFGMYVSVHRGGAYDHLGDIPQPKRVRSTSA